MGREDPVRVTLMPGGPYDTALPYRAGKRMEAVKKV